MGRLAQMVQQAVHDDLLRYHKTLLVWTNKIQRADDLRLNKDYVKESIEQNQEV